MRNLFLGELALRKTSPKLALDALPEPLTLSVDIHAIVLLARPSMLLRVGIVPLCREEVAAEVLEVLPVTWYWKLDNHPTGILPQDSSERQQQVRIK